jgi:hypothetical protein
MKKGDGRLMKPLAYEKENERSPPEKAQGLESI